MSWMLSLTVSLSPVILTPFMEPMTSVVTPTRFWMACIHFRWRTGTSFPTWEEAALHTERA